MLKKTAVVLAACLIVIALYFSVNTPIFKDYSDTYEVYLENYSSTESVVKITNGDVSALSKAKGISFKAEKERFDLVDFLDEFDAKIIFTETVKEGTSFYCYSGKIKYRERLKGKIINLHVFIGSEQVTVGTPLIYGSF